MRTYMLTPAGGAAVNQVVITGNEGMELESYGRVVARMAQDGVTVFSGYDYSQTTIKYVCRFLGMRLQDIRKGIADGKIRYADRREE